MNQECRLKTEGYQVLFNLISLDNTKEYVDLVAEFILDPRLVDVSVKSLPSFIAIKDLRELIEYFEQHITCLQTDPEVDSYTFVPMELGFQLQALSGDVSSLSDGEFSIRFMVNVGQSHEEASHTYVGGESVVTVEDIQSFITSMRTAIAVLSH